MKRPALFSCVFLCISMLHVLFVSLGRAEDVRSTRLPNSERLTWTDDLSVRIVDEAHALLDRKTSEAVANRAEFWKPDFSSTEAYVQSIEPNRQRLMKIIGLIDARVDNVTMERFGTTQNPALVAETDRYQIFQVRWPVLEGLFGEGLLLEPKERPVAQVVWIPDADQTPEQWIGLTEGVSAEQQIARRLAENGCRVIIPVLISRSCEFSGNPSIVMTNQPHREWIYRQAYEMGRHIIGYEVQKVLAAVDWFEQTASNTPIGVAGYAEGGLIAFYASAVDTRIDACLTSGYFDSRQQVWEEPISRNVWSLLREFGDAEIASLIAPRGLVVEYSHVPKIDGPPPLEKGRRGGAAPGKLSTPTAESVVKEFQRAESLDPKKIGKRRLLTALNGSPIGPGSAEAASAYASMLRIASDMDLSNESPDDLRQSFDASARQARQVRQLTDHVQLVQRKSGLVRREFFLDAVDRTSGDTFVQGARAKRDYFWREVIGALDDPLLPPNAKTRLIYDRPTWTGYEVVLDVFGGLHAWGILCIPKDITPGERRPVVVCQHGLEGVPADTITTEGRPFRAYQSFTARLAERGFITFAPYNLYRGKDQFRTLQRKANPLRMSLFSIITRQHEQILAWLKTLEMVDAERIGFYGLSYGGKTAMRVPAVLDGYCLSICSADFNDWIRKNVTVHSRYSYMFTGEWEMVEFDLGRTFNYAEMAYLIFPRPFMVERGHHDGVAPDPWVAYEFAKIRWLYTNLNQGDRTGIEFFNGPHSIHGVGTFDFLHKHLRWPKPNDMKNDTVGEIK